MNEILDHTPSESSISLKAQNKKFLISIIGLAGINILLFSILPIDFRSANERFAVALPGITVGTLVIGFILGLIVALFPYKKLSFSKKYLRSSFLIMLILQLIMFAMMLINVFFYVSNTPTH